MLRNLLAVFIALILGTVNVMATPYSFTQEDSLLAQQGNILNFWATGEFSSFTSIDSLDIHYALFMQAKNEHCIVISPGRSESYLKYQELAFDLNNNGFNVAIIDHRGQGLSSRMLQDRHKGYVDNFNDYVVDFHQWVEQVVSPKCQGQLFLMAHSMGGNISALYLQQFPKTFTAAVLSSPMIAVNGGSIPDWLGKSMISMSHFFDELFNKQSSYFFGHGTYKDKVFVGNDLMQSEVRFQQFSKIYQQYTDIQLGGVTFAWLDAALVSEQQIFANLDKLTTPTLVLQAEKDTVVSNEKQTTFCQQLSNHHPQSCPNAQPVIINDALHELWFEKDAMRNEALSFTLDWFNRQKK